MHWLETVANAYYMSEAPQRYFYWAAAAALSATVRKNVWIDKGGVYKLYPNIYAFIVGRSGIKKGIPVKLGKDLAKKAGNTRIISGRASFQRILQDLGKAFSLENGGMVTEAHTLITSGELSSLFIKDPDALNVFTDLYSTHENEPEWTNSLKGSGVDILKNPCVSLLAATNEELFSEAVQAKDVQGGFIARTFIIYSDAPACINALIRKNGNIPDIDVLAQHLIDIKDAQGEFTWEPDAMNLYEAWYDDLMLRLQNREIPDPTGMYGRLGDQVLKLVMIISLAFDKSLVIKKEHVEEAINECEVCCTGVKIVTMGGSKGGSDALSIRAIIKALINAPNYTVSRQQLMNRNWASMSVFDFDKYIETLMAAGAIKATGTVKNPTYELLPKALNVYVNFKNQIF